MGAHKTYSPEFWFRSGFLFYSGFWVFLKTVSPPTVFIGFCPNLAGWYYRWVCTKLIFQKFDFVPYSGFIELLILRIPWMIRVLCWWLLYNEYGHIWEHYEFLWVIDNLRGCGHFVFTTHALILEGIAFDVINYFLP